jgi:hypothetical protein
MRLFGRFRKKNSPKYGKERTNVVCLEDVSSPLRWYLPTHVADTDTPAERHGILGYLLLVGRVRRWRLPRPRRVNLHPEHKP